MKIFNFIEALLIYTQWLFTKNFGLCRNSDFDLLMASHSVRIYAMPISLFSLLKCSTKPKNIYLTIDTTEKINYLKSKILNKLEKQGVKIIYGEPLGPHSKYHHYIYKFWDGKQSFMIFDDDMIYRKEDIKILYDCHKLNNHNACMRSYKINLDTNKIAKYRDWEFQQKLGPSIYNIPTGVGGLIVSSGFIKLLLDENSRYLDISPSVDDLYYGYLAMKNNMPFFQATPYFYHPKEIPFTQSVNLRSVNVNDKNNIVARKLFSSFLKK